MAPSHDDSAINIVLVIINTICHYGSVTDGAVVPAFVQWVYCGGELRSEACLDRHTDKCNVSIAWCSKS